MPSGAPLPPFGWSGTGLARGRGELLKSWANPVGRFSPPLGVSRAGFPRVSGAGGILQGGGQTDRHINTEDAAGAIPAAVAPLPLAEGGGAPKIPCRGAKEQQIGFLCCLLTRVPDCVVETDPVLTFKPLL